jgi:hypothetical protein
MSVGEVGCRFILRFVWNPATVGLKSIGREPERSVADTGRLRP